MMRYKYAMAAAMSDVVVGACFPAYPQATMHVRRMTIAALLTSTIRFLTFNEVDLSMRTDLHEQFDLEFNIRRLPRATPTSPRPR
jgi:hypothetical protein